MDLFRVRVVSPWFAELQTENVLFSRQIKTNEADALLCEWAPSQELLSFPRRKAWYCCEPTVLFRKYHKGWARTRARLQTHEFLFHNHPRLSFRVSHVTHFEALSMNQNSSRIDKAVAIVSNFGGSPLFRPRDMQFRNRFVTHPLVELYGRENWRQYRRSLFSTAQTPEGYQGALSGDWHAADKREIMSRYKVCICLENSCEANYFTEKFVEAVVAGCIPVYRAHPSVAATLLEGAKWIDPAEYGNDAEVAILAALASDLEEFQEINSKWLRSPIFATTGHVEVFRKIASILCEGI